MTQTATRIPSGATVRHADGRAGHVVGLDPHTDSPDPGQDAASEYVCWTSAAPAERYEWVPACELTVLRVRGVDLPFPDGGRFREILDEDSGPCTVTVDHAGYSSVHGRVKCGKPTVLVSYLHTPPQPAGTGLPDWMNESLPPAAYGKVAHFHADGTPGHGVRGDWVQGTPKCPQCKGFTLKTTQEPYGDKTVCTAQRCGHTSWYGIGD